LVPSLTELAFALGLGPWLVARTGFCIHPHPAVRAVPKVGGTKDVNLDKLQSLAPTHVLVNVDENPRQIVQTLRNWARPPEVVVTHPLGPDDIPGLIDQLAAPFHALPGVTDARKTLRQECTQALVDTQPGQRVPRRVLYLVWRNPWMTVARDTYISRLLARVDWMTWPEVDGGPQGAARYPVVKGDEPWLAEVQRVLLSSEPCRFDAADVDAAQRLCPGATVQRVDGEALGWWGSRTVQGLALARRLADDAPP
jgi:hypothetical protein